MMSMGMPEFMAADMIGEKIIEAADRLIAVDKAAPGSVATYGFELDGVRFKVQIKVDR